ncbi:MAG: plasmid stabilization protein [Candidatus Marithrix sp.]
MATLTIRSLEDSIKKALRIRAAENDRSMEEEARIILRTALKGEQENSNIWNLREKFIDNNGLFNEELILPFRKVDKIINPVDD